MPVLAILARPLSNLSFASNLRPLLDASAQSNHLNKSRLKVLQSRQQYMQELIAESSQRLHKATQNEHTYSKLLRDLIYQGLLQLLEPRVLVQGRSKDAKAISAAIPEACKMYEEKTKKRVEVLLEKENCLPDTSAGGVVLSVMDGRIILANTLEKRLEIASEAILPQIRYALFGPSAHRTFFD